MQDIGIICQLHTYKGEDMNNEYQDWRSILNPPTKDGEIWIYAYVWDDGWCIIRKYYYMSEGFKKGTARWMPIIVPQPPTDVDFSLYETP
jgi:hypothetical protein